MGKHKVGAVFLAGVLAMGTVMTGCSGKDETEGKTVIEMVQYKPEAVDIFEQFQDEFNATHDDIYLKIDSPNDAMTILKTKKMQIRIQEKKIIVTMVKTILI